MTVDVDGRLGGTRQGVGLGWVWGGGGGREYVVLWGGRVGANAGGSDG